MSDVERDLELVRRANEGDGGAFEALYSAHRDWTIAVAHRFTCDAEESLDIAQETFMWLMQQFPGFELRARLRTVLYAVVRNAALARQRNARVRTRHHSRLASSHLFEDTPDPDHASRLRDLDRILATLSEIHREILYLRYVDDFDLAEIAAVLEIPIGTVKSRLHHAIAALRSSDFAKNWFVD